MTGSRNVGVDGVRHGAVGPVSEERPARELEQSADAQRGITADAGNRIDGDCAREGVRSGQNPGTATIDTERKGAAVVGQHAGDHVGTRVDTAQGQGLGTSRDIILDVGEDQRAGTVGMDFDAASRSGGGIQLNQSVRNLPGTDILQDGTGGACVTEPERTGTRVRIGTGADAGADPGGRTKAQRVDGEGSAGNLGRAGISIGAEKTQDAARNTQGDPVGRGLGITDDARDGREVRTSGAVIRHCDGASDVVGRLIQVDGVPELHLSERGGRIKDHAHRRTQRKESAGAPGKGGRRRSAADGDRELIVTSREAARGDAEGDRRGPLYGGDGQRTGEFALGLELAAIDKQRAVRGERRTGRDVGVKYAGGNGGRTAVIVGGITQDPDAGATLGKGGVLGGPGGGGIIGQLRAEIVVGDTRAAEHEGLGGGVTGGRRAEGDGVRVAEDERGVVIGIIGDHHSRGGDGGIEGEEAVGADRSLPGIR